MSLPQSYVTVSRRPPDIEDYIDMLRRYRSWIIGPMFAGLVLSTVVAFLWPDTYESTAVMRITPQQISEKLIPSEYSSPISQRLQEMEQDICSHNTLEALITKPSLNLYPRERAQKPMEDVIQQMRHDIQIQIIGSATSADGRTVASAFSIKFPYTDKYKAQAVVQELVSRFIEQNHQVQRRQANTTTVFLDDVLKSAKTRLDDLETQITNFRIQNQGKLPEEFQANQSMLNSLQIEASNLESNMQRSGDLRTSLETQLKTLTTTKTFFESNSEDVLNPGQVSIQNQQLLNTEQNLTNAEMRLRGLQKIYGENFPDVISAKAEIELLKQRKEELEKEQEKKASETPKQGPVRVKNAGAQVNIMNTDNQIEATRTQIANATEDIKRVAALQAEVNRKIALYEGRIQASPLNQKQWEQLNRDYVLAKEQYDQMMRKRDASETAQNVEEHKAGENLELLDAATLPDQPTQPKRVEWAAVGTAMGLMIGVMLAGVKEMKNTSLKNLKDVRAYTNLPVLSSVPLLENALLVRRKRRLFWLAWSGAFIVGSMAMGAAMYYYFFGSHS